MTISEPSAAWSLLELLFDGSISQIWPLFVLPAVAALISDRVARRLPPTNADWRAAAALAAFPGLVTLALVAMIIGRSSFHFHADDLAHHSKYHLPMLLSLGIVGYALFQLRRRNGHLNRIAALAGAASPRLRRAANKASIEVRELPEDGCECFVAGVMHPVAFVSRGLVERMTDEQLVAALHHERAHAASRDPAILAILSFLSDLAPGTDRALTAYRQARERHADAEAARRVGPCALASALIAVAKNSRAPVPALGMAGPDAGTWRLAAILGTEPEQSQAPAMLLWSGITANFALLSWPLPHVWLAYYIYCS